MMFRREHNVRYGLILFSILDDVKHRICIEHINIFDGSAYSYNYYPHPYVSTSPGVTKLFSQNRPRFDNPSHGS